MTKRIAKGPFVLTLPTGEKKEFCGGEEITGDNAEHWWVQAHSMEVDAKVEAARVAEQAADAEELQQLRDENAELREIINRGTGENSRLQRDLDKLADETKQLRAEAATLRAEAERVRAESASMPPAAADQKKKKDDKDSSSK